MDQIVSFFVGDQACDVGLAYYYVEANQMFDEDDPINHDIIFYPHHENIIPRALFFGDNLEMQTCINQTKVIQKQDTEEGQEIQEVKESFEQTIVNQYMKKISIKGNQFYKIPKTQDNQSFNLNYSEQQKEEINDKISSQLEQQNRCDGFQVVIDTSVYSSLGHLILESLREQSTKTPILCTSIHQENGKNKLQEEISKLNRILSLINYSEQSTVFVPYTSPLGNFNFFSKFSGTLGYQQQALLFSSMTLNYRIKNDQLGFESYMQRMTPFSGCNIFNLASKIPLKDDLETDHILNHKENLHQNPYLKPNYMDRIIRYEQTYRSYAESYSLRGVTNIPKELELKTLGIDIRIIDDIYNIPSRFDPQLFQEKILDNYGQPQVSEAEDQEPIIDLPALPMHTCIFSNECYKYNLRNFQNQIGQLSKKTFMQFEKDEFGRDDLHELLQKYEYKIESYGGLNDDSDLSDSD